MFLHLHVLENYFHSYTFIFLFSFFFKYVISHLYIAYKQCDNNFFQIRSLLIRLLMDFDMHMSTFISNNLHSQTVLAVFDMIL